MYSITSNPADGNANDKELCVTLTSKLSALKSHAALHRTEQRRLGPSLKVRVKVWKHPQNLSSEIGVYEYWHEFKRRSEDKMTHK